MAAFISAEIPEAREDPEIAALTLASCSSNIESVASMIRNGIPADRAEAPVAALEHARRMAAKGAPVDVVQRFYRLGHAFFWERLESALTERIEDRARLVEAIRETAAFAFRYVDLIAMHVGAEHAAELARRRRQADAVRRDAVAALLAGNPTDLAGAERALGIRLDSPLVAFACWTAGDASRLEIVAGALAELLDAGRPLVLAEGADAVIGWTAARRDALPRDAAVRLAEAGPDVHVTIADPARGADGFRHGRAQADRARRVVELSGRRPPTLTRWRDVALVATLAEDIDAARAFVASELGALAANDETTATLRRTLLADLDAQGGHVAAAAAVGVHRNTMLQRIRRAEELRGRPATDGLAALHAALLLAETLGANALPD